MEKFILPNMSRFHSKFQHTAYLRKYKACTVSRMNGSYNDNHEDDEMGQRMENIFMSLFALIFLLPSEASHPRECGWFGVGDADIIKLKHGEFSLLPRAQRVLWQKLERADAFLK